MQFLDYEKQNNALLKALGSEFSNVLPRLSNTNVRILVEQRGNCC